MSYSGVLGDKNKCECADAGCPIHKGITDCREYAVVILYRVDMEDNTGTLFCEACGNDALASGLFCDGIDFDESEVSEEERADNSGSVCPDCERPNQFGELCPQCQRERE